MYGHDIYQIMLKGQHWGKSHFSLEREVLVFRPPTNTKPRKAAFVQAGSIKQVINSTEVIDSSQTHHAPVRHSLARAKPASKVRRAGHRPGALGLSSGNSSLSLGCGPYDDDEKARL
jgi:hypothetical protein